MLFKVLGKYLLLFPAILILWILGLKSIEVGYASFDDTVTLHQTILATKDSLFWLFKDVHTIFFNFSLFIFNLLFGSSLKGNHLFSLIITTLSLFYFYKSFEFYEKDVKRIGPVASAIYASSYFIIAYGTQGRSYPLLLLMGIMSYYYLLKFLKTNDEIKSFCSITIFLYLTHLVGLIQIFSQAIVLYFNRKKIENKKFKKFYIVLAALIVTSVIVSFLYFIQYSVSDLDEIYKWIEEPHINKMYRWFEKFSLKNRILFWIHFTLILFAVLRCKRNKKERLQILLLFSWMILPPVILTIKSKLFLSFLITRGYISSIIPFYLLTAIGMGEVDQRLGLKKSPSYIVLGIILVMNAHRSGEHNNVYKIKLSRRIDRKPDELIVYHPQMMALNVAAIEAPECIGLPNYIKCLEERKIYNYEKALDEDIENEGEITLYAFIDEKREFYKYKEEKIDPTFDVILSENIDETAKLFVGKYK